MKREHRESDSFDNSLQGEVFVFWYEKCRYWTVSTCLLLWRNDRWERRSCEQQTSGTRDALVQYFLINVSIPLYLYPPCDITPSVITFNSANINKNTYRVQKNVRNAHLTHPRLRVSGIQLCTEMYIIHQDNNVQRSPVITTSVYTVPRLQRQIFCGSNYFLTVNHNITLLDYNNTRLSRCKIFSPFHDVITKFDSIVGFFFCLKDQGS